MATSRRAAGQTVENQLQPLQRRGVMRGDVVDQYVTIARSWGELAA